MQTEALKKIVLDIKSESQTIELKAATQGCPTRLFDTLSSFSNQDEGGIIIFGVDEKQDYKEVGVYDPQDIQKKINEQLKITYNNSNRNFNVRIDLTNGQAVLGNLEVKLSTRLLRLIYEEMLNAIEYASEVTINNMKRSKKVRSLKK